MSSRDSMLKLFPMEWDVSEEDDYYAAQLADEYAEGSTEEG